jgi:UDP-N-acetylmuramyl pentapeptide phosphotransferase/UDP-N-acetylglucosamine-1-phosphate transferase
LGAKRKLLGQLLIASGAYFLGIAINQFQIPFTGHVVHLGFWSWPVTVCWLVVMTNFINLIDGVDGLAGGICLMLMSLLVYVGGGAGPMSFIAAGMAGALLGFLRFNFPPARIYMGDGGAYFLGFLIGCISIVSSQKGTIFAALSAPLLVLALPILDTLLAILRRGLRGRKLARSDTKHKSISAREKRKDFTNRVLAWWELFQFILPSKIRREVFEPAHNDLKEDYLTAKKYQSKWATRWIAFCFICRTVYMVTECLWVAVGVKLEKLILLIVPEAVRRIFRG